MRDTAMVAWSKEIRNEEPKEQDFSLQEFYLKT